jgi:DNA-binding response OmpR family regulator
MQSKTILIIEDDQALAEAIQLKLDRAGFFVAMMISAENAIDWLKDHVPDFIWLDVLLPGMSGIDFLEFLRKDEKYKNIPVLIVSVSTGPDKMKRAFELNIIDFISKSDHEIKDVVGQVSAYFDDPARGGKGPSAQ